jgi:hypothetical protein
LKIKPNKIKNRKSTSRLRGYQWQHGGRQLSRSRTFVVDVCLRGTRYYSRYNVCFLIRLCYLNDVSNTTFATAFFDRQLPPNPSVRCTSLHSTLLPSRPIPLKTQLYKYVQHKSFILRHNLTRLFGCNSHLYQHL